MRAFVLESRFFGKTIRLIIGDPRAWDLAAARAEVTRMKTLVDEGKDPRVLKAEQRVAHEARGCEKRQQVVTMGEDRDRDVGKSWRPMPFAGLPFQDFPQVF